MLERDEMRAIFSGGKIFQSLGKAFDMYGNSVTLTINNSDTSKSTIGTVLTVLTLSACFALAWPSFFDVIKETNARVKYYKHFGATKFDVNASSMFIALATYYSNDDTSYVVSTETNHYQWLDKMTEYYGECRQCRRSEFQLPLCGFKFDPKKLSSITRKRAENISGIFTQSSYCMPNDFKTPLLDEDLKARTHSSISIRIPDNFHLSKNYSKSGPSQHNQQLVQQAFAEEITHHQNFRLLLIHHKFELDEERNVTSMVDYSYVFHNLKFRNSITGVPLSYDIYIQQYNVTTERQFLLFFSKDDPVKSYYSIKKIEINQIKSSDLVRKHLRFNFRIHPIVTRVKIKSELFTQTMAIFGSYWSMMILLGRMLAKLWGGYFYKADLYNTIFRYHDEDPDYDPDAEEKKENPDDKGNGNVDASGADGKIADSIKSSKKESKKSSKRSSKMQSKKSSKNNSKHGSHHVSKHPTTNKIQIHNGRMENGLLGIFNTKEDEKMLNDRQKYINDIISGLSARKNKTDPHLNTHGTIDEDTNSVNGHVDKNYLPAPILKKKKNKTTAVRLSKNFDDEKEFTKLQFKDKVEYSGLLNLNNNNPVPTYSDYKPPEEKGEEIEIPKSLRINTGLNLDIQTPQEEKNKPKLNLFGKKTKPKEEKQEEAKEDINIIEDIDKPAAEENKQNTEKSPQEEKKPKLNLFGNKKKPKEEKLEEPKKSAKTRNNDEKKEDDSKHALKSNENNYKDEIFINESISSRNEGNSFIKENPKPVGGPGSDGGGDDDDPRDIENENEGGIIDEVVDQDIDSVDDEANQYRKVTNKSFTENELDDLRLYLFKKKNTCGPNQEIVFKDIDDNPVPKGKKKVLVNPYVLMFEPCLKRWGGDKYKHYYKMIKNCDRIIKSNLSIHYLIKKHFEVLSIKSLLMAKYPFKCGFDSIDVNNPLPNQSIMDEYEHEYQQLVVQDKPKKSDSEEEEEEEDSDSEAVISSQVSGKGDNIPEINPEDQNIELKNIKAETKVTVGGETEVLNTKDDLLKIKYNNEDSVDEKKKK